MTAMKFDMVRGLASQHSVSKFGELWSISPGGLWPTFPYPGYFSAECYQILHG